MATPSYAAGTSVTVERSKAELDGLLGKHGARNRVVGQDDERHTAVIGFELDARRYAIRIPLPVREDAEKRMKSANGAWLWDSQRKTRWIERHLEQWTRERWRVAVLLIKSKLEIVRLGASTFEREFLADLLLPDGETAGEKVGRYIEAVVRNGYHAPLSLPAHEGP